MKILIFDKQIYYIVNLRIKNIIKKWFFFKIILWPKLFNQKRNQTLWDQQVF